MVCNNWAYLSQSQTINKVKQFKVFLSDFTARKQGSPSSLSLMHQGYRSVAYVRSNWYKDHVWGKFPLEFLCSFPGKGICLPPLCLLYRL